MNKKTRRWSRRPDGSTWGDWGVDDQLGRLNLLTPACVKTAAEEIVTGERFCLSLPLDYPGGSVLAPHRRPPQLKATERKGRPFFNYPFSNEGPFDDCGNDDCVTLYNQYSTQWDSLAHIGCWFDANNTGERQITYYNGYTSDDITAPEVRGANEIPLGIHSMAAAAVQGRGVMVDLLSHLGTKRQHVGYRTLMDIMKSEDVIVEAGDILCLHTGFAECVRSMHGRPDIEKLNGSCAVLDGADAKLLQWITDSGIAAIAADNYAVEGLVTAADGPSALMVPLHVHCLFKLGIPLGELWYFTKLAAWLHEHRRSRFFLTAPPLRLPGAVGSPVTPVATV